MRVSSFWQLAFGGFVLALLFFYNPRFAAAQDRGSLTELGSVTGVPAEISAFDPASQRLFVVSGTAPQVTIIDLSDPANPLQSGSIPLNVVGFGNPTSVDVFDGLLAVAVVASPEDANGGVFFFNAADGQQVREPITVGPVPDMLTFTPDGQRLLVAIEGQTSASNPEGGVQIIELAQGIDNATVTRLNFRAFNGVELDFSVITDQEGATNAQDFEPEYISIDPDGRRAYVALQENNAIAVVNLDGVAAITDVYGLGFKDHAATGNEMDASDQDSGINLQNWPVLGVYQPDGIAAFSVLGQTYLATANEGDSRAGNDVRASTLTLDPTAYPAAATLQQAANLGRLEVFSTLGREGADGSYDQLYSFGGRSFSIYTLQDGDLVQVYDSGAAFEQITAAQFPALFNSEDSDPGEFDARSDNKGPEPEGITTASFGGSVYAYIGLERFGAVLVYDVTDPQAPAFVQIVPGGPNQRPEGLRILSPAESPTGLALLVVTYEGSDSLRVFQINGWNKQDGPEDVDEDGDISPVDGILVTNRLGLAAEVAGAVFDVDDDGTITRDDLLRVLNRLAAEESGE